MCARLFNLRSVNQLIVHPHSSLPQVPTFARLLPHTGLRNLQSRHPSSHSAECVCRLVQVLVPIQQYAYPSARYYHLLPARLVDPAVAVVLAPNKLHRLPLPVRGWPLRQHEPREGLHVQWQVRRRGRVLPGCKCSTTPVSCRYIPPGRRRRPAGGKLHSVRTWCLQP